MSPQGEFSNQHVAAPMNELGESRDSVQTKLGLPLAVKVERIPNAHIPTQTDEIQTLIYQGVSIRIYKVVELGKEMLLSVRMTQNHPEALPDLIGRDRKDILSSFGVPVVVKSEVWKYEAGETKTSMQIEFEGAMVVAVQWDYYVD